MREWQRLDLLTRQIWLPGSLSGALAWSFFIPAFAFVLTCLYRHSNSQRVAVPVALSVKSSTGRSKTRRRCHGSYLHLIFTLIRVGQWTEMILRSLRPGQNFWGKDTIQQKASEWEVENLCGYLADSLVAVSQPWIGRISGSRPGWKNKGESAALTHRHSFISPLLWVTACDSVSLPVPLSAPSSFSQPIFCSFEPTTATSLNSLSGYRCYFIVHVPGNSR